MLKQFSNKIINKIKMNYKKYEVFKVLTESVNKIVENFENI